MPRPLSASARNKLLDAARELVAEVGPRAVTVDAVAQRSGVAKTTLYRHFENSHDLIVTALRDLPASIETPNTGDLRDDLVELVCRFTQRVAGPEMRRMFLSVLSHATDDSDFADIHDVIQKERRRPIMDVLEQARARGQLAPNLDPELAADLIEGPFVLRRLVMGTPTERRDIERIIDALMPALTN